MKFLKYIRMKKILFVLLTLQLAIGLYLVTLSSTLILDKLNKLNKFNDLFNYKKTYVMKTEVMNTSSNNNTYGNINYISLLEDVFNNLKKENIINNSKVYFSIPFYIEGIDEKIIDKYKDLEHVSPKDFFQYTCKILVNHDFSKDYNVKMQSGRWFEENDFNSTDKIIPIILGADYKNNISVGEKFKKIVLTKDTSSLIFSTKEIEVEFVVVGIMESNSIGSLLTKSNFVENYYYSDSLVLIPTVPGIDDLSFGVAMSDMGVFVEFQDINSLENVTTLLNNELLGKNLHITSYPLYNEYSLIKNNFYKDYQNYLVLGVTLLIISVVGVICVTLGEMSKRKSEFGIKLAVGSTVNDICSEIFIEMLNLSACSFLISYLMLFLTTDRDLFIKLTTINQMIFNLIFISSLTVILSIAPILMIQRTKIIDMIRSKK